MSSIEASALGLRVGSLAGRLREVMWELADRQLPHNDSLAETMGLLEETFGVGQLLPEDAEFDGLRYQYLLDIDRLYADAISQAEVLLTRID
jgi:hypothetical protein